MKKITSFSLLPIISAVSFVLVFAYLSIKNVNSETMHKIPIYVGSDVCKACHEKEYNSFMTYAKKSKSFNSIERVRKGLTVEEIKGCYYCHTTGYGKPGGFISPEKTPHLKNAGCEVCHGPGEFHRHLFQHHGKECCGSRDRNHGSYHLFTHGFNDSAGDLQGDSSLHVHLLFFQLGAGLS